MIFKKIKTKFSNKLNQTFNFDRFYWFVQFNQPCAHPNCKVSRIVKEFLFFIFLMKKIFVKRNVPFEKYENKVFFLKKIWNVYAPLEICRTRIFELHRIRSSQPCIEQDYCTILWKKKKMKTSYAGLTVVKKNKL